MWVGKNFLTLSKRHGRGKNIKTYKIKTYKTFQREIRSLREEIKTLEKDLQMSQTAEVKRVISNMIAGKTMKLKRLESELEGLCEEMKSLVEKEEK